MRGRGCSFTTLRLKATRSFFWNCPAAIAIGSAPDNYQAEPGIQNGIKLLEAWLVKNMDAQTPLDRVDLLWASTKLRGLLTPEQAEQDRRRDDHEAT